MFACRHLPLYPHVHVFSLCPHVRVFNFTRVSLCAPCAFSSLPLCLRFVTLHVCPLFPLCLHVRVFHFTRVSVCARFPVYPHVRVSAIPCACVFYPCLTQLKVKPETLVRNKCLHNLFHISTNALHWLPHETEKDLHTESHQCLKPRGR